MGSGPARAASADLAAGALTAVNARTIQAPSLLLSRHSTTDMSDDPPGENLCHHDHEHEGLKARRHTGDEGSGERNISLPAASKHAVAPFLAKHIPSQYNPLGQSRPSRKEQEEPPSSNTKFCYRHRPDLKCRRQANEPSMEQLQTELGRLSQSDQQAISHVWSLFSAAPSKHRSLMLQGILAQCCFPQLSFISASVRDLIKIDFLSALPSELGFKVLCYLDTTSLCKAAQVSRRWRSLADDDVVWHRMCEQHIDRKCTKCGWGLPLLERKRLRTEKRQIQMRALGRGINQWSPQITPLVDTTATPADVPDLAPGTKRSADDTMSPVPAKKLCPDSATGEDESYFQPRLRPWKDVYKDRFKVGTNWKYGRCTTKTFKGHANGVMCLQFDESILATGSYDATVKIWDIETGECLRTLAGHTSGIRCLQFDDTKLMSGSMDNTVKVWNWRTGQLLRTFNAHVSGVISLNFDSQFLVSGSMDQTIRVYDLRSSTAKCTFLLRGHTDWINAVKIDSASRTLLSASDDCTIRLWDLDTKRCIKVFEGHVGQVQQCLFLPHEFDLDEADLVQPGDKDDDASSTSSRTPPVTDPHTNVPTGGRPGPPQSFSSTETGAQPFWPDEADKNRPAPPRYMLTGALDSTIRLWDVHAPATPASSPPSPCAAGSTKPPVSTACLRTFFGHVEGVWSLAADHLRMVSGSEDRMVKIWDPRTGKCERTWTGHAGPVTCVGLSDSRLVSGSEDCEVRMLVFGDERCRETGE